MNAADQITKSITQLSDWRGTLLARLRQVILAADPEMTEEWKWETPVWSHNGNVVAVGAFQDHVKLNFFKGATLPDPHRLFNAGLDAKATRAIDLYQGDTIDEANLKELVRAAVALNSTKRPSAKVAAPRKAVSSRTTSRNKPTRSKTAKSATKKTAHKKARKSSSR